ncbi:MAG: tRNA lysidine(34) synthetase TilS [Alphaproteobacteria bacterium]
MAAEPLTLGEFADLLEKSCSEISGESDVAVGLSGGPDSFILTKFLSGWAAAKRGTYIHALTVDHGLRPESAREVDCIARTVEGWPSLTHAVLKWEGEKPETRIQEEARTARYRLIGDYCRSKNIRYLILAHHQNDQMETFLFRLAKGSGLDGLTVMKPVQAHKSGLTILRPLLGLTKDRLVAACEAQGLAYINDPSNASENFFRARLRKFIPFLESEGFTAKRLAVTSDRLERARHALHHVAAKIFKDIVIEQTPQSIAYRFEPLEDWPDEIGLRVLIKAIETLRVDSDYLPRREKIETLFTDLCGEAFFRKRTLGGLVFSRDDAKKHVIIEVETIQK